MIFLFDNLLKHLITYFSLALLSTTLLFSPTEFLERGKTGFITEWPLILTYCILMQKTLIFNISFFLLIYFLIIFHVENIFLLDSLFCWLTLHEMWGDEIRHPLCFPEANQFSQAVYSGLAESPLCDVENQILLYSVALNITAKTSELSTA